METVVEEKKEDLQTPCTLEEVAEEMSPADATDCYRFFKLASKNGVIAGNTTPEEYIKMVAMIKAGRYTQPDFDSCNVTFIACINSVCDLFEIPKMYVAEILPDESIDLKEEVKLKFNIKDETEQEEQNKSKKVINFSSDKLVFREKSVDMQKLTPKQQAIIDDINSIISKCLPVDSSLTHEYKILSTGLVDLVLSKDKKFIASFAIDPNIIHGNGNYIVANSVAGNIWVPFKKTDIITKVLSGTSDGDYVLGMDEITECMDSLFINPAIYQYVDLSHITKNIKKLSKEDYKQLGINLDAVLLPYFSYYGPLPRFRVSEFTDVSNFKLISDDKSKVPLATMPNIFNGCSVELRSAEDIIITLQNGMNTSCKMPGKNAPNLQETFDNIVM